MFLKKTRLGIWICAAAILLGMTSCGASPEGTPTEGAGTETTAKSSETAALPAETTGYSETTATQTVTTPQKSNVTTRATTSTTHRSENIGPPCTTIPAGHLENLRAADNLPEAFRNGYNAFALRLIQAARQEGQNTVLSPASVYLALAMTANGAAEDTQAQMLEVLGVSGLADLNTGCRDLQSVLTGNEKDAFRLANGIWVNGNTADCLRSPFRAAVKDFYGARIAAAPFTAALIRDINAWVSDNTAGRITDLLQPEDTNNMVFLINTLLFEGKWQFPFTKSATQNEAFHAPGGDMVLPMMRTTLYSPAYYEDTSAQVVRLPFEDGRTSLLLALPKQEGAAGLDDWIGSLTVAYLEKLLGTPSGETKRLRLILPRFSLPYNADLSKPLQSMGMSDAFKKEKADFSSLANLPDPLYIGKVAHRTRLEVDEKGVLAAAATATVMSAAAAPHSDPPPELRFDRPFFCALVDEKTGTLLFGGAVNQPENLPQ